MQTTQELVATGYRAAGDGALVSGENLIDKVANEEYERVYEGNHVVFVDAVHICGFLHSNTKQSQFLRTIIHEAC
jgi:hypothetical protein